jgi:hypothetical protein
MNIPRFIARTIVAPVWIPYTRPLSIALLILAMVIFTFLILLSLPPIVDAVIADKFLPSFRTFLQENSSWLNRWAPSLRLSLEILSAITIGGSIFALSVANTIKAKLDDYKTHILNTSHSHLSEYEKRVYRNLRKITYLIHTISLKNLLKRIPTLFILSHDVYSLFIRNLPLSYGYFMTTAVFTSFPGGFYGLLAFIFFTLLCTTKLIQIYLPLIAQIKN